MAVVCNFDVMLGHAESLCIDFCNFVQCDTFVNYLSCYY
jgi:hypothetical protein